MTAAPTPRSKDEWDAKAEEIADWLDTQVKRPDGHGGWSQILDADTELEPLETKVAAALREAVTKERGRILAEINRIEGEREQAMAYPDDNDERGLCNAIREATEVNHD